MGGRRAVPTVLFDPAAAQALRNGVAPLAQLLACTLGPTQGRVLVAGQSGAPEWLGDAATIARRYLEVADPAENVGAMLLRHLVWRVRERVGDGTATAAVLAQALLTAASRAVAAGADPMLLRQGLLSAGAAAQQALQAQLRPVRTEADLHAVARTALGDSRLSQLLAEIFDLLGPDAVVTIEDYVAPYFEREYHQGGRWQARLVSPIFHTSQVLQRAVLNDAAVAVFSGEVQTLAAVEPLLRLLLAHERRRILLVAQRITGPALATLALNQQRGLLHIIPVELRRVGQQYADDCADLTALSGARLLAADAGERLDQIALADIGQAQRVEANAETLHLIAAPQAACASQIATLQSRLQGLAPADAAQAPVLRERIARLKGCTATLKIGATSKLERAVLRQQAEQGLRILASALRDGVVPGGGVAFLHCIPAVQQLALNGDAAYGALALAQALEAPFRQIVHNAGWRDPAPVLSALRPQGPGYGYDALHDRLTDLEAAGILDAAEVLAVALQVAVSGVASLLTTGTLVLKRHPQVSLEP